MISGSVLIISCGVTTLVMCSTPIAAADSAATSISEKPSRSNPVVKVSRFGLCRLARAAMAVESMPPERNDADRDVGPHVLGDRVLERGGDLAVELVGSSTGRMAKSGWK